MRKDAGFDVTDRIGIAIACGETLQEAVDAAREDILRATLGVSLAAQPADGAEWKEWNINGRDGENCRLEGVKARFNAGLKGREASASRPGLSDGGIPQEGICI